MKKWTSIGNKLQSVSLLAIILLFWQLASTRGWMPSYMLPSPMKVINAIVSDFGALLVHLQVTLTEAFVGLAIGIILGFLSAVLMDRYKPFYRALYPLIVLTQTVPTVAIAPLLVLWMGYGILPKITLIVIVTFFPIAVGLYEGFGQGDPDMIDLMRAMGANNAQIFRYIKWPSALNQFFAALKISVSYSVVGAVIAEWLGGYNGLGVYMIRVKKSFSYDKMFAVIFIISAVSLLLMSLVNVLKKYSMPWEQAKVNQDTK
ncbi:MAG: ABC transporter permease [Tissierellia bacterium]|nr:ABC transporter permease [Tissierellia bacterium]